MLKSNLVIQTAFLGDLILSVPTFRQIKKKFPDESLVVICKKGLGDFLIREKIVDQVIEVEKSNSHSYVLARQQTDEMHILNLYCVHRSLRSLWLAARIKAQNKVAFKSLIGYLVFDEMVDFNRENPEVLRQIRILETTDVEVRQQLREKDYSTLNLVAADSSLPQVPPFFSFGQREKNHNSIKKIALFPGSVWATKKWTESGFIELCKLLLNLNFEVHLLGGPDESSLCQKISEACDGRTSVLAGQLSIADSVRALADYDLVICNDSAATHMAAYNATPVISIFGPTVPAQGFRPWSNSAFIVENTEMDCRPCGAHGHQQCPLGHHNCMKSVAASHVLKLAQKILS
jgi:heptosyltransferase II